MQTFSIISMTFCLFVYVDYSSLIIMGYFNIHVDNLQDMGTTELCDTLIDK